MEVRPADLGDAYQTMIVLRRARTKAAGSATTQRPVGAWAQRWVRRLNLTPEVSKASLPAVVGYTRPYRYGLGGWTLLMLLTAWAGPYGVDAHLASLVWGPAALFLFLGALPASIAQVIYTRAVSEAEVNKLRPTSKQPAPLHWTGYAAMPALLRQLIARQTTPAEPVTVESEYLDLIVSILRLPDPELSVQAELRGTLQQIGNAVAAVRQAKKAEEPADARDLIGDAEMLASRARREADQVIAASLLRQARAKIAQAKIVDKNVTLRRRTRALESELRAQIAAAHASVRNLSSQGAMSLESGGVFRTIATAVQTLTTEASSVNDARAELAAALAGGSVGSQRVNTADSVAAGTGVTSAALEETTQIVRSRTG